MVTVRYLGAVHVEAELVHTRGPHARSGLVFVLLRAAELLEGTDSLGVEIDTSVILSLIHI